MFDCGISKIIGDVVTSMEEENEKMIYKAVQSVGIDVDKKQLEKALLNAKSFYIDGYKDAKKQYERKWTPVSEGLPKLGQEVLCYCQAEIYDVLRYTEDGWFKDAEHCYMDGFVIAWMPKPEPYKSEVSE